MLDLDQADALVAKFDHSVLDRSLSAIELSAFRAQGESHISAKVRGSRLRFTDAAAARLVRLAGIPAGMANEYGEAPELIEQCLAHSCRRRSDMPVRLTALGDEIVAVEKPEGPTLPLPAAWTTIREQPGVIGVQSVTWTGNAFELRVLSGVSAEPKNQVGDISHAGVSLTLNGRATVSPFVLRLLCQNGLVAQEALWSETVKDATSTSDYRDSLAQSVRSGLESARGVLESFVRSAEIPVEQPAHLLVQMLREAGVAEGHIGRIMTLLPVLPRKASVYDVVNLVTAFARERKKAADRQRFECLGGILLAKAQDHRCDHCHRPVLAAD